MTNSHHLYEVRPRKDHRGVDLISDALPFGRLWYGEPNAVTNAINYAKFFSRSHDDVIRVYDVAGNVIETHEHKGGRFSLDATRSVAGGRMRRVLFPRRVRVRALSRPLVPRGIRNSPNSSRC
jgi:hypothetical protein